MPCTTMPRRRQFVGVTPGTAPDVEQSFPRAQSEHVDDVIDLLHGALGEGVPEVRLAEVVGDRLEPVLADRAHRSIAARPLRAITSRYQRELSRGVRTRVSKSTWIRPKRFA